MDEGSQGERPVSVEFAGDPTDGLVEAVSTTDLSVRGDGSDANAPEADCIVVEGTDRIPDRSSTDQPAVCRVVASGTDAPEAVGDCGEWIARDLATDRPELLAARVRRAVERRERARREAALETAVCDAVDAGVCVLSADRTVAMASPILADQYGADDPASLVGEDWTALFDDGSAETLSGEVESTLESAGRWDGNLTGRRPDGETFPVTASIVAVGDGRAVAALRDVTDRRRRQRTLRRKERRLEEFASVVSHDLRNPISVAGGRLDLAREADDLDEASQHLDAIERSIDRMERIVEDVLTLVRGGDDQRDPEPVDLDAVVRRAWANVDTAEARLQHVPDQTIVADEPLLVQGFENLFRNAVQHGGDDVTVRVGAVGSDLYVEDDGPGIPDDERGEVFEPGFTTDADGTGLGLPIVRRIVRSHGWSIDVEEGADGGARFRISGIDRPDD